MPAEKRSKDFQLSISITCLENKKVDMSYKLLSKSETQTFKKKMSVPAISHRAPRHNGQRNY